ncbi:hypothetical protein PC9H_004595 [Pleurotus ostreatus]|uniref:Uncharacterized protein n=1 Tax=Pleurotus ostreatus TaxID=5322 RepID=A0A8H7DW86_PLEOS|nr:uncharacterized protein PC9H_004595 [Pleurotus ostreatus]KAF7432653.1 hypothetical protein PC9H_004595 [Pleurotus ostreatus]
MDKEPHEPHGTTYTSSNTLEAPSLALSDIMHFSPPPSDFNEDTVVRMRRRVQEMEAEPQGLNDRERELADIVLQLTSPMASTSTLKDGRVPVEPTQLINQAETISALVAQRDKLIEEAEYNMAKLESEREEWLRTAEALVTANSGNGRIKGVKRDVSDVERQCAAYESDNKSLREKLAATQLRLTSLEAELAKLRPLLLMQQSKPEPEPQSSVSVPTTIYGTSAYLTTGLLRSPLAPNISLVPKGKGKEREVPPSVPEDGDVQTSPVRPVSVRKSASKHPKHPSTLFSDARSEHILLAARRLGRIRTNALSEMAMDRELASAALPHDSTSRTVYASPGALPQTPKAKGRRQSVLLASGSPHAFTPAAFSASMTPNGASPYGPWYGYGFYAPSVYGLGRGGYGMGLGVPASPTSARTRGTVGEPATTENHQNSTAGKEASMVNEKEGSATPKRASEDVGNQKDSADTPLASLLSAARMMDTAPGDDPAAGDKGREEVSNNTRPQRAGRGQRKVDDKGASTKPSTSRRRNDATTALAKDEQVPPKTEKVQRVATTGARRSKRADMKKRQAEQAQGERPTKRRRVSGQSRNVKGHSRSPQQKDTEADDDSLHSTSVSNASTNGARLIASPQNAAVRDDGADPGDSGGSTRPIERVRSALDVLADQASAAASEVMTQRRSSTSPSSSSRATGLESVVDEESSRPSESWVQRDDVDDDDIEGSNARPVRAQRIRALTAKERDRQEREAMKKPRGRARRSLPSGEMSESTSGRTGRGSRRARTSNVVSRDLSPSKAAPIPEARMISPPNHVGLLSASTHPSVPTDVEVVAQVDVDSGNVASTSLREETESVTEGQIVVISPTQAGTPSSADEIVKVEIEGVDSHVGPSINADASITEGGSNALSPALGMGATPGAETNEIETNSREEEDNAVSNHSPSREANEIPIQPGADGSKSPRPSHFPVGFEASLVTQLEDSSPHLTVAVDTEPSRAQETLAIEPPTDGHWVDADKGVDGGDDAGDEDAEGEPEGDQDSFYDPVPIPETAP